MALELCTKCGKMHYRTDPCITPHIVTDDDLTSIKANFDKTAYQREYMRKRRAALKAAKAQQTNG